jgi:tRNA pseudouridine55 synthase
MSRPRRPRRVVNGILLLDKPAGLSSNAALLAARRLYQADKAGHTGSLDPMATGMLPICFGQATKLCGLLLDATKRYRATLRLGARTDTGDAEGTVIEERPVHPVSRPELEAAITRFHGEQWQTPPMYSAIKQGGERLYTLARQGQTVERAPRRIIIHALRCLAQRDDEWELEVHCSKGTYVRVLAEDLAASLGQLAHLSALRRLAVSPFPEAMVPLSELEPLAGQWAALDAQLLPLGAALADWPALTVTTEQAARLRRGQPLPGPGPAVWACARDEAGEVYALVERAADGRLWPRRWLRDDP